MLHMPKPVLVAVGQNRAFPGPTQGMYSKIMNVRAMAVPTQRAFGR